jgi:hypothetical protein
MSIGARKFQRAAGLNALAVIHPSSKWISGQSESASTADGSFAAWRGRAVEIGGSWAATNSASAQHDSPSWSFAPGAPYATVPRLDFAAGGPLSGETWAQAAAGTFDSRWASDIAYMKTEWGARLASNFYIRFCHEFNGNWYPWSVNDSDIDNFKTAWIRYYNLVQANFSGANLVWCANAATVGHSYDVLQTGSNALWPGDAYVDIVGIDSYNNYPWVNTLSTWNAKIISSIGLERFRQFALTHGKPLAICEWSNSSVDNGGGGGDAPQFFQYYFDWLVMNGGTGAGNVLYEVLFNVTGYGDHYELYASGVPNQYEPQSVAVYLNRWNS